MPLYEYQCDACGHRFEIIQKFSDLPLESCPKCGASVHKLQSAPAFHLKGSGWYITDYAKKDQSATSKSDGDSKDGAAGEQKDAGGDKKDAGGDKKDPGSEKRDAAGEKKDAATKSEKPAEKSSSDAASSGARQDDKK